jgi:hypothetical protein
MTEIKIDEHNLIDQLRAVFPEIEERYRKELQAWKDEPPGNYNILGFVFKPYLKEELAKGELTDFLERLAKFMERVCTSGDVEAINVIWLKLFKLFLAQPEKLKLLWPVLGPATKSNIEDAARRWGLVGNLPLSGRLGAIGGSIRLH